MPEIKPVKILSFSSEDDLYPVKNLLKESSLYQWKCKSSIESEVHVEFQFENLTRFTRIELGNNGSAFVEIRVSRQSDRADYQVLLGSTSLMSPPEALKCESLNRVKYFKETNFSKEISTQKWDVMKLVCTQPFNKTLQFGLSFIKFFGETDNDCMVKENQTLVASSKIDVSKLFDNPSNEDDWLPGSLFVNRRKFEETYNLNKITGEKKDNKSHPTSSNFVDKKVEEKPLPPQLSSDCDVNNTIKQSQARVSSQSKSVKLLNSENNQLPNLKRKLPSPDLNKSIISQPKKSKNIDLSQNSKLNKTSSISNDELIPSTSSKKCATSSSNNKSLCISNVDDDFENIFKHVAFVLSGYQNPLRNNIRDKALSMGGKYRGSWTSDCTHLICAFNNTPKFKEVLGKGIIVSEKWILECFDKRKLLPWREFRLKGATSPPMKINKNPITKPIVSVNEISSNCNESHVVISRKTVSIPDNNNNIKPLSLPIDSLPKLPQIFENMHFFFYGNFENVNLQFYKRFIIALGGTIHDYMNLSVKIVISNSFWDHNFDEALITNPDLKFVNSSWIDACDEQNFVVSTDDFEILK